MILGIDSSAVTAGCALFDGEKILAEGFLNNGHTHSQTLLPMIENVMESAGAEFSDIEKIAVTNGPGSFTGLRIGVSCVKGMAFAENIPVVGVSTLEAAAYNFLGFDGIVCAAMDARLKQVYNAIFRAENGKITRLCEDRAVSISDLINELSAFDEKIILVGDGAELLNSALAAQNSQLNYQLASPALRYQKGSGVCLAARDKEPINADALMPKYLRLPQAERERMEKLSGEKA